MSKKQPSFTKSRIPTNPSTLPHYSQPPAFGRGQLSSAPRSNHRDHPQIELRASTQNLRASSHRQAPFHRAPKFRRPTRAARRRYRKQGKYLARQRLRRKMGRRRARKVKKAYRNRLREELRRARRNFKKWASRRPRIARRPVTIAAVRAIRAAVGRRQKSGRLKAHGRRLLLRKVRAIRRAVARWYRCRMTVHRRYDSTLGHPRFRLQRSIRKIHLKPVDTRGYIRRAAASRYLTGSVKYSRIVHFLAREQQRVHLRRQFARLRRHRLSGRPTARRPKARRTRLLQLPPAPVAKVTFALLHRARRLLRRQARYAAAPRRFVRRLQFRLSRAIRARRYYRERRSRQPRMATTRRARSHRRCRRALCRSPRRAHRKQRLTVLHRSVQLVTARTVQKAWRRLLFRRLYPRPLRRPSTARVNILLSQLRTRVRRALEQGSARAARLIPSVAINQYQAAVRSRLAALPRSSRSRKRLRSLLRHHWAVRAYRRWTACAYRRRRLTVEAVSRRRARRYRRRIRALAVVLQKRSNQGARFAAPHRRRRQERLEERRMVRYVRQTDADAPKRRRSYRRRLKRARARTTALAARRTGQRMHLAAATDLRPLYGRPQPRPRTLLSQLPAAPKAPSTRVRWPAVWSRFYAEKGKYRSLWYNPSIERLPRPKRRRIRGGHTRKGRTVHLLYTTGRRARQRIFVFVHWNSLKGKGRKGRKRRARYRKELYAVAPRRRVEVTVRKRLSQYRRWRAQRDRRAARMASYARQHQQLRFRRGHWGPRWSEQEWKTLERRFNRVWKKKKLNFAPLRERPTPWLSRDLVRQRIGYPSLAGPVRRRRRVYLEALPDNGWWRPLTYSYPNYNPAVRATRPRYTYARENILMEMPKQEKRPLTKGQRLYGHLPKLDRDSIIEVAKNIPRDWVKERVGTEVQKPEPVQWNDIHGRYLGYQRIRPPRGSRAMLYEGAARRPRTLDRVRSERRRRQFARGVLRGRQLATILSRRHRGRPMRTGTLPLLGRRAVLSAARSDRFAALLHKIAKRNGGRPIGPRAYRRDSRAYRRWMRALEVASKRRPHPRPALDRHDQLTPWNMELGRRRVRFPGSGERHGSYEAPLNQLLQPRSRYRRLLVRPEPQLRRLAARSEGRRGPFLSQLARRNQIRGKRYLRAAPTTALRTLPDQQPSTIISNTFGPTLLRNWRRRLRVRQFRELRQALRWRRLPRDIHPSPSGRRWQARQLQKSRSLYRFFRPELEAEVAESAWNPQWTVDTGRMVGVHPEDFSDSPARTYAGWEITQPPAVYVQLGDRPTWFKRWRKLVPFEGEKAVSAQLEPSTTEFAPILFDLKSKIIIPSEGEQARLAAQKVLEAQRGYQLTAEYAEAIVTTLRSLISRWSTGDAHSAYWSLRLSIGFDPFKRLRDRWERSHRRFVQMERDMLVRADEQPIPTRTRIRYRLQPARYTYTRSFYYARRNWMRAFGPQHFALYLEDPERYAWMLPSRRTALRMQPQWATTRVQQARRAVFAKPIPRLESQFLDGQRFIEDTEEELVQRLATKQGTHRLETFLQTSRRRPTSLAGEGCFKAGQHSFFRPYSTLLHRCIAQQRRVTPTANGHQTVDLLPIHRRLKEIRVARGRSAGVGRPGGFLPLRARAKSLRNRQYLQRKGWLLSQYRSRDVVRQFGTPRLRSPLIRLFRVPQRQILLQTYARATVPLIEPIRLHCQRQLRQKRTVVSALPFSSRGPAHVKARFRLHTRHSPLPVRKAVLQVAAVSASVPMPGREGHLLPPRGYAEIADEAVREELLTKRRAAESALQHALEGDYYVEHRAQLWTMLTAPYMKREREVRHWLKDMQIRGKLGWLPEERIAEKVILLESSLTAKQRNAIRQALPRPILPEEWWKVVSKPLWHTIRRRIRRLEWRESDRHFHRRGWHMAFRLYPNEYNRVPWLQALMYRRATYLTRRREYRRYSFPREQKRLNWLQRFRKGLYHHLRERSYIKGRRWPRYRIFTHRLLLPLLAFTNRRNARIHFTKRRRHTPVETGFGQSLNGRGNRLDVTLMLFSVAPTLFWARAIATFGVVWINGVRNSNPAHRLQPGDAIRFDVDRLERLLPYFQPYLYPRDEDEEQLQRFYNGPIPENFSYRPDLQLAIYQGLPREEELHSSSRLSPRFFRWFALDSR